MAASDKKESAASTRTFGTLTIDRRVLTTPSRSIAIANIATISVGTHVVHRPRLMLAMTALGCAALAFVAYQSQGQFGQSSMQLMSFVLGVASLTLVLYALKPDDKTHYLLISSSDGILTRFTGESRAVLDEVRDLLSNKINTGDEAATFTVNFADGRIDSLSPAPARTQQPTPSLNGIGRSSAMGNATAASSAASASYPAQGGYGRASAHDTASTMGSASSPGGHFSNGHMQPAAVAPSKESYVDFRALLPAVVEMQRFYARQSNTEHLEQRLSELELLMRSGAQTPSQKVRVRELTRDLAHILQAYQPAVQVFQQISGMAA